MLSRTRISPWFDKFETTTAEKKSHIKNKSEIHVVKGASQIEFHGEIESEWTIVRNKKEKQNQTVNKTELKRYFLVDLLRNKIDLNCFVAFFSSRSVCICSWMWVCAFVFCRYSLFVVAVNFGECVCMCLSRWITFITSSFKFAWVREIFRFGFRYFRFIYFFTIEFQRVFRRRRKQEIFD